MKTKPDETALTLWMDGELEGDDLQCVEAWVQDHPELLAERDAVQLMRSNIQQHIPRSIEPPYPDFFNQHVLRHIDDESVPVAGESSRSIRGFWRWLAFPVAAGVMAACFYMGTQVVETSEGSAPLVAELSSVYTPDGNVKADMFKSTDADATVIVLEGLEDIPDELDMVGRPSIERSGAVMVRTEMTF
ncbi:MAG: hypothetical protein KJO21_10725 [Verrucomicrobiae bacterium]|nr:hypothetical protein [Verrucomicrobiae bacterium]NNJ42758.1 hypothetical protein [Akkermansiaceae bacterium]